MLEEEFHFGIIKNPWTERRVYKGEDMTIIILISTRYGARSTAESNNDLRLT